MGLAFTIARRSLLGRPGRTIFSILGVAMGIATVVAVYTVDHVTVLSRTLGFANQDKENAAVGADMEVRPVEGVTDPAGELLRLEGIAGVAAFFQNDVMLRPVPRFGDPPRDDLWEAVQLFALDAVGARTLGVYHVDQGRQIDPDATNREVLLGGTLARELGVAPGDRVYLAPPVRAARKACVDGQLQTVTDGQEVVWEESAFDVAGVLSREGIGRTARGRVVVIDYEAGRALLEEVFIEPRFWVKRDRSVDIEALESDLTKGFTFERNEGATVGQAADERAFRNGVFMAGLFALLLGLFVIFHTLSMSLLERMGEIGSLHTLGASRLQVARVFFTEALVISGAAGVVGFLGGLTLARAMLFKGITTLGVASHPVRFFDIPWRGTLSLTLLGVAIALVGSVFPILSVRSADVVSLLRGEDLGRRRSMTHGFNLLVIVLLIGVVPAGFFAVVPFVGSAGEAVTSGVVLGLTVLAALIAPALLRPTLAGTVCAAMARPFARIWPLAAQLASRSLSRSPARVGAGIAAIALVTSAFVSLRGMTNSLRAEIEVWAEEAVLDKVFLQGLPKRKLAALAAEMADIPEIIGIEPGDSRAYVSFRLLGMRTEHLKAYGPLAEDPFLVRGFDEEQGIILSGRLARQLDLGDGDLVPVRTSGHGVVEFRVIAISDAYGYFMNPDERAYGVVSDRYMKRFFCLDVDTVDTVALRLDPDADPDVVATAIWGRLKDRRHVSVKPGPGILRLHLEDISRDFVVFDIILLLTAVLAGLGVLNGQLLAALERQKELGILRALGMTRRQLATAVLLESGIMGLVGGVVGVIIGSALTPVLVSILRVLSGLDLPQRWAQGHLALFVLGAFLLAILAGLYPIWRMNRMDAVRAVRTG